MASLSSLFAKSAKEKDVFYFSTNQINNLDPHYFICIQRGLNEVLIFTCCTTQKDKREKYFQQNNYDLKSLVHIAPTTENGLKQDSYVDCNKYFQVTVAEIQKMHEQKKIECRGEVSDEVYEQLLIGLHASQEIEEEIKKSFPDPDDIK
jgi:hypothetical protein